MSSRRAPRGRARPGAQFVVGSFVCLVPNGPVHRVVWRGTQPMPSHSDWPGEIAVYRLDNDYWDCYYEYQLYPAQPWDAGLPSPPAGS
jgi:hypothetical protein